MSQIIDGRRMARELSDTTAEAVAGLKAVGIEPALAVVLVGSDPASEVYVRRKIAECGKV